MKMRHGLVLICLIGLSSGCATHRSFTLTKDHQTEVHYLLKNLNQKLPLKKTYQVRILSKEQMKPTKGVPAISGTTILLPEDFIKYVYKNYHDDRWTILSCVMAHEICHTEFDLESKPPIVHFSTDQATIKILGNNQESIQNYYNSLQIVQDYWLASRSAGGHLWNIGWNLTNAASVAYGGPGYFVDWFATDLKKRLKLIKKKYPVDRKATFKKSTHY